MAKAIKFGAVVVAAVYILGFVGESIGNAVVPSEKIEQYHATIENAGQ